MSRNQVSAPRLRGTRTVLARRGALVDAVLLAMSETSRCEDLTVFSDVPYPLEGGFIPAGAFNAWLRVR
jgi:hypothetical protein